MGDRMRLLELNRKITKGMKTAENFNTGLLGEQMILSAYNTMPLDKLINLRFIINKIIQKKKKYKRINECSPTTNNNHSNNN